MITYSATLSALEKGGQWEKALELFQEVKDNPEIEVNGITTLLEPSY